ncbi:MAG: tetratricopeptide repeat protein [Planctomycetota bacterium]
MADDKPHALVTIQLKDGTRLRCWVLDYGEEGLRVRKLASDRDRRIGWDELADGDRSRLRAQFKLDLSENERKGLVEGARLHFEGGSRVDGVLEKVDEKGEHWLRRGGSLLPYPRDRIVEVEPVLVNETEVYGADEVYRRVIARLAPKTADRHVEVADHMRRASDFDRAVQHYKEAIRLKPSLRWKLKPNLDACEALAKDKALARAVRMSRKLSRLDHRYDDARALLNEHLDGPRGRSRLVRMELDDLDALEAARLNREYHERKNRAFKKVIADFLLKKRPTLAQARSYVENGLAADLTGLIQRELGLTDKQVEEFNRRGSDGSAHWATYHHASFIFDPFAKPDGRGPEDWWTQHSDTATRSTVMRAYAAEKLPELFELVRVKYKPCIGCGGNGTRKQSSVRSVRALGNKHAWLEKCDRCWGCGRDRVVAYR